MSSLKGAIQGLNRDNTELLGGVVVSVSPLKIQLNNDSKIVLGGHSLCVPNEFSIRNVNISIDGVVKPVIIDDSLKQGEAVYLLRPGGAKKYIVIGRG